MINFSPGDRQAMTGFYQVYHRGQAHFQIGENKNLFDWTYVGNVACAHLLAADKLNTPSPESPLSSLEKFPMSIDEVPPLTNAEISMLIHPILPVDLTAGHGRVPTC